MRKTSLFKNDDLQAPETKAERFERRKASMLSNLDMDPDKANAIASKVAATEKKQRYAPVKEGTRAIARISLDRVEIGKDIDGKPIFGYNLRESKGAKWIDVKFILEGKYNNRWIKVRFMLSASEKSPALKVVRETRQKMDAIRICHGLPAKTPLRDMEGLRVPIILGIRPRHGDGKPENFIEQILCPDPMSAGYHLYEAFAKSRKVQLLPDEAGNKRRWIDFPGWTVFPFTPLYMTLKERINSYHERVKISTARAVAKMENAR